MNALPEWSPQPIAQYNSDQLVNVFLKLQCLNYFLVARFSSQRPCSAQRSENVLRRISSPVAASDILEFWLAAKRVD